MDKLVVNEFSIKSDRAIECIEKLVQNLLKITKLDAGSILTDKHSQNISDMMNDIIDHFEMRAAQEHKEIILSGQTTE